MSAKDIVHAWKNEEYFKTLSASEVASIPANPAGDIKLCSHSRQVPLALTLNCFTFIVNCSAAAGF